MKAVLVVLSCGGIFYMLHKAVLCFESVDEFVKCYHSNEVVPFCSKALCEVGINESRVDGKNRGKYLFM